MGSRATNSRNGSQQSTRKRRSTTKGRAASSKSTSRASTRRRTAPQRNRSRTSGSPVARFADSVGKGVKGAGSTVGAAAAKAKVPALATATALVGAAGGAALASRDSRKRVLGLPMPSKSGSRAVSKDLAEAAKSIGSFGEGMGSLAAEVRRVGEVVSDSDSGSGRSPIEIVLQGLTHRR